MQKERTPAPARRRGLFEPRERDGKGRPQRREPVGVPGADAAPLGRRLAALGIDVITMGAVGIGVLSLLDTLVGDDSNSPTVGVVLLSLAVFLVLLLA